MKVDFSLSPSSLNLYRSSQLLFYYVYVAKARPDTEVVQCFASAGSCIHDLLERYALKEIDEEDLDAEFEKDWKQRKLDELKSLNGRPLDKEIYRKALHKGKYTLDNVYSNPIPEETIEYDLLQTELMNIRLKGIIDLRADENVKKVVVDWKTSSSVDDSGDFRYQGLHYAMLVYKKYGYVPDEMIFEYVKIGERVTYKFTEEEIIEYEEQVNELALEIARKGFDINKYEVGNEIKLINNIFNAHKQKCIKEIERRNEKELIEIIIKDNRLYFKNLPKKILRLLKMKYSYLVPGYHFTPQYKSGKWDGKKSIMKSDGSIPYTLINDFKNLIAEYNKNFNTNYELKFEDQRNPKIVSKAYDTEFFKNNDIEMREYQNEAIKTAIEKKVGIISLPCGSGKTVIAAELIKQLNRRTLVIINRLELITQTVEEFEDYLGVKIGSMVEGKIDTTNQITVASIQTLAAILKRDDETSRKLRLYLHNVTLSIYDESHGASDIGMYGTISRLMTNIVYSIGLSATPYRVT